MIEEKREALSAMLDDELPGRVFDQLVTDLAHDEDLRKALSRYRLIGDVLRGDGLTAASGDLIAVAIHERLVEEPAIMAAQRAKVMTNWGRGFAGLAIAASVALLAVGMLAERPSTSIDSGELAAVTEMALGNPQGLSVPAASLEHASTTPSVDNNAEKKLARYLAEHNEFASRGAANGFMSYATFVAYDSR